ncbi:MAG: hypothetical protein ACI8UD_000337 [Planctomycetota bacterium]|jgi:hypothetical protein
MRLSSSTGLMALLLVSCQAVDPGLPPAHVTGLPWGRQPEDRLSWSARQDVERGKPERALVQLATILAKKPRHVDANRLRQDLLRVRGRRGRLLIEAKKRVYDWPDDGHAHYLLARILDDPKAKLSGFRRAAQLAPGSMWPWLGLAHTLRSVDRSRSLAIYERLFAAADQHPLVAVAYASALRESERWEESAKVYRSMRDDPRMPGVAALGLAQVALSSDDRVVSWASLLESLRIRPFDPGVQALVHGWLETTASPDQARQVVDVLREDGERLRAFGESGGSAVLADLLAREGQSQAARAVLERQLAERPTPALRRSFRQLLLSLGEVDAFLEQIVEHIPLHVVDVEANQVRGRWLRLLRGPWHAAPALATAKQTAELLAALRDVGFLAEVELLAEVAMRRFPAQLELWTDRQDEVRSELAFEAGLRRLLYQGYQKHDSSNLATVVVRVRELSQRVLGRDVVGTPPQFSVPLVGEMLDPFVGDLAMHLSRYNRHLVLGRRSGGTAEGLLVTRLSLAELPAVERQELQSRCYEVVGMDRDVKSLGGMVGSDLAGVALLNHFLIDHDAVVDWALGLRDRRRIGRQDGDALRSDPVPADVGMAPLDAAWRLALGSKVADADLDAAVLGMIRDHERRHLVDSSHYMPIESNLLRGAGLLFQFGLSPATIEAEMERRAELAALALSPHTELVLAHIVDFYGDPPLSSPHHRGFSELLVQVHDGLLELGVRSELAVPSQWHTLDMSMIRKVASRLLAELP